MVVTPQPPFESIFDVSLQGSGGPEEILAGLSGSTAPCAEEYPDLGIVSWVAHEIRAPLAALELSSELLLSDLEQLDPEEVRSLVVRIYRGTTWLSSLVENLLCSASLHERRFSLSQRLVDLPEVISEIRPITSPFLDQKQQELRVHRPDELPSVWADRRSIGQVLINLILNASKFGEPGTPIDLTLSAQDDRVRVSVADRGPGLPPGDSARLFAPFYQAGHRSSTGRKGLGLGLAIAKSIVEAHPGQIGADNRPDGGAEFWFELQAVEPVVGEPDGTEVNYGEGPCR